MHDALEEVAPRSIIRFPATSDGFVSPAEFFGDANVFIRAVEVFGGVYAHQRFGCVS
jgi:hypothetical protein